MDKKHSWTVIGAGPAGIASIGGLLDAGVAGKDIIWVDPYFSVGDFGRLWHSVPSNTVVEKFINYLDFFDAFKYNNNKDKYTISKLPTDKTCQLSDMADALKILTDQLKEQVNTITGTVNNISQKHNWELSLTKQEANITKQNDNKTIDSNITDNNIIASETVTSKIKAKKIILATGSTPYSLDLDTSAETIALEEALDPKQLKDMCNPTDKVAVFGSSHSAILILRDLYKTGCEIANFYRSPLLYAINMPNGEIIHDNTGLKGEAAQWARDNLAGQTNPKLIRALSTPENVKKYLPDCNKVIYATGFTPRSIQIEGIENIDHSPHTNIIAPGIFGLGIAFPNQVTNSFGAAEFDIGLLKMCKQLQRVMPLWLKYPYTT